MRNRGLLLIALLALSAPAFAADANKMIQAALKLYEKGSYDKALKQFVKVLRADPNNSMAREYMLLCSQKIVETKLGHQVAETVEKEITVEKQIQEMNVEPAPPPVNTAMPEIALEAPVVAAPAPTAADKALEAAFANALRGAEAPPPVAAAPAVSGPPAVSGVPPMADAGPAPVSGPPDAGSSAAPLASLPDLPAVPVPAPAQSGAISAAGAAGAAAIAALPGLQREVQAEPPPQAAPALPPAAPAAADLVEEEPPAPPPPPRPTAQSILQQRESLADELRRRSLGNENIVQLVEKGGRMEVTLFLNRLFLPHSEVLRDDAYPILDHVISRVRGGPKRKVVLKAQDSASPAARAAFQNLTAKRCTVVFSYLIYNSFQSAGPEDN